MMVIFSFLPPPQTQCWVTHFVLLTSRTEVYHFVPDFLCLTHQISACGHFETQIMHNPKCEQAFCVYSSWFWGVEFRCCCSICHALLNVCELHQVQLKTQNRRKWLCTCPLFCIIWFENLEIQGSAQRPVSFWKGCEPKSFIFHGNCVAVKL